ncbi:hypothetical protein Pmar_PMAR015315 [Perkinsus marinus ATCC 50983]|uniref:Uncharacterized protein n=1 Tax=Perkinsus marinus (strain ATCC 50983 / TXsc) TaxID=423536 RepID=C5KL97_PERM5|nr:hypothetical protein Pmar_PMAR015315 [Perkinsus marinus ATCC 50983]EER14770.1 hypothetical protein Pmar_PMAR015315 [Perkinsus marinus ATCC 50983]|eukprot:XP_002782974.1 hypothetical protein Pmar_PMAR015315 [Perkinsus marinus ATCC 50983]
MPRSSVQLLQPLLAAEAPVAIQDLVSSERKPHAIATAHLLLFVSQWLAADLRCPHNRAEGCTDRRHIRLTFRAVRQNLLPFGLMFTEATSAEWWIQLKAVRVIGPVTVGLYQVFSSHAAVFYLVILFSRKDITYIN